MTKPLAYCRCGLRESSSWIGLVALLALAGVKISPEQMETIVSLGVALIGCIKAFFPDRFGKAGPAAQAAVEDR